MQTRTITVRIPDALDDAMTLREITEGPRSAGLMASWILADYAQKHQKEIALNDAQRAQLAEHRKATE